MQVRPNPRPNRFTFVSAVHLFLLDGGRILLLRRFNTGYEDGNFSVVAGHLDGNEEVVSAAIREAREETGVDLKPGDVRVVGVMHRRADDERIDFFLAADRWSGEVQNAEPDKCDLLYWSPIDRLPVNLIPYVRRAIENYVQGVWFDSVGWHSDQSSTPQAIREHGGTMSAGT